MSDSPKTAAQTSTAVATTPFYRDRRVRMALLAVTPVIVIFGLWWFVSHRLLLPAVPDAYTAPDRVAQFLMHPEGLPRLGHKQALAVLETQMRRLAADAAFREALLAEIRTSPDEDKKALRQHLFDVYKPELMADIRKYHELPADARQDYLDERIVFYNRLQAAGSDVHINKDMVWGPTAPSPQELIELLYAKTTEEERQLGMAYAKALAARVTEILADPTLKAEFEARIAAAAAKD